MSDLRLFPDDDDVTRGLRAIYAAPMGESYWNELQSRVMARVADVELGWWTELDRWARPALAAAAILLLSAGVAMFRVHQSEADIAADAMLNTPTVPVSSAIRPAYQDEQGARLRSLLGR